MAVGRSHAPAQKIGSVRQARREGSVQGATLRLDRAKQNGLAAGSDEAERDWRHCFVEPKHHRAGLAYERRAVRRFAAQQGRVRPRPPWQWPGRAAAKPGEASQPSPGWLRPWHQLHRVGWHPHLVQRLPLGRTLDPAADLAALALLHEREPHGLARPRPASARAARTRRSTHRAGCRRATPLRARLGPASWPPAAAGASSGTMVRVQPCLGCGFTAVTPSGTCNRKPVVAAPSQPCGTRIAMRT